MLAELWGLGGFQALSRGVYTPAGQKCIILFVTRQKQGCLTQYNDFLADDLLFWEGENGHGSDRRIAAASENGEEIHLFYRERHHMPFTYYGRIILASWQGHADRPSEFVFKVAAVVVELAPPMYKVAEEQAEYAVITHAALSSIDKQVLTKSRGIAQRLFRGRRQPQTAPP